MLSITREQSTVDREVVLPNPQLPVEEFIQSVLISFTVAKLVDSLLSNGLGLIDPQIELISEPLLILEKFPILEPLPIVPLPIKQVSVFVENVSNSAGMSVVSIVEGVDFFQNFDPDCNFDSNLDDGCFYTLMTILVILRQNDHFETFALSFHQLF